MKADDQQHKECRWYDELPCDPIPPEKLLKIHALWEETTKMEVGRLLERDIAEVSMWSYTRFVSC